MWLSMTSWGPGDRSLEVLFDGGVGYILDSSETAVDTKVHVEYNNVIILRELPNQTFMSNITS